MGSRGSKSSNAGRKVGLNKKYSKNKINSGNADENTKNANTAPAIETSLNGNSRFEPRPPVEAHPEHILDSKQPSLSSAKELVAATPGMIISKGGSIALPANDSVKLGSGARNGSTNVNGNNISDSSSNPNQAAFDLAEIVDDELALEEDFDSPVYAKQGLKYKVGDPIVYPPPMPSNMVFSLKKPLANTDDSADVDLESETLVTFAYKSLAGKSSMVGNAPDKPNQDSVAVVRNKNTPHRAIFAVFDGHGPYGEHASHFCRMELLKMYSIALEKHAGESSEQILEHTLKYLDRKFAAVDHKAVDVDPIVSGTTAIVVMFDGDDIIAANVGDSRAILASRRTVGGQSQIDIMQLSDDHKPERDDERQRILASDAQLMNENEVRARKAPGGANSSDSSLDQPVGKTYICRHVQGEIIYGVLFTRSIGDVDAHRHLGVSSEPEFKHAKVNPEADDEEQVVILASDGVWDMMTNEEVAKVALSTMDPHTACDMIVKTCAQRWQYSGEGRRDDITACVIGLGIKFGGNSPRDARQGSYFGLL